MELFTAAQDQLNLHYPLHPTGDRGEDPGQDSEGQNEPEWFFFWGGGGITVVTENRVKDAEGLVDRKQFGGYWLFFHFTYDI
jgi:hypothetical protein